MGIILIFWSFWGGRPWLPQAWRTCHPCWTKKYPSIKVLDCDFVVIMFGEFVLERQYYIFVRMGGWGVSIVFYGFLWTGTVLCSSLSMFAMFKANSTCSVFWSSFFYKFPLLYLDIDGAYFGTTFPQLFLMTYGHLKPQKVVQSYVPRVFGFKIHKP